ncbi:MAG: hypothetical protein ACTHPD_03895 [Rhizomicrobium sp.]|jgi:hypothetical protein
MNAKRKQKRRRHAEARKKSTEKLASVAGSAKPAPRRGKSAAS